MTDKTAAERMRRYYRRQSEGSVHIRGDMPNSLAVSLLNSGVMLEAEASDPKAWAEALFRWALQKLKLQTP